MLLEPPTLYLPEGALTPLKQIKSLAITFELLQAWVFEILSGLGWSKGPLVKYGTWRCLSRFGRSPQASPEALFTCGPGWFLPTGGNFGTGKTGSLEILGLNYNQSCGLHPETSVIIVGHKAYCVLRSSRRSRPSVWEGPDLSLGSLRVTVGSPAST